MEQHVSLSIHHKEMRGVPLTPQSTADVREEHLPGKQGSEETDEFWSIHQSHIQTQRFIWEGERGRREGGGGGGVQYCAAPLHSKMSADTRQNPHSRTINLISSH